MNYPTETDNPNKCTKYNGWKNWETWNVALWINNDYGNYLLAKESKDYADFISKIFSLSYRRWLTGDGVSWTDPELDLEALDEVIQEINE